MYLQWPSTGKASVADTLMPAHGVLSSTGLGTGGLLAARSFGVRSAGVGYSKTSFLTTGLAAATPFGIFKPLGAWFTSSTLTIPFSMERSQPRLCWLVSIFERSAPVALSWV